MPKLSDKMGEEMVQHLTSLAEEYDDILEVDEVTGVWIIADMLYHEMASAGLQGEQIEVLVALGYTAEQVANAEGWLCRKLSDLLVEAKNNLAESFND